MENKGKVPLAKISTNKINNNSLNSTEDTKFKKQNSKERMRRLQAICVEGKNPLSIKCGKDKPRKRKVQHIDTPNGKRFACSTTGGINERLTKWMKDGTRILVKLRAFAPGRGQQQRGPNRMLLGSIVAFDKHWNLILRDVDEAYFPSLRLGKVQAMPGAMPSSIRYKINGNKKKKRPLLVRHLKCSFITGSSIIMIHEEK